MLHSLFFGNLTQGQRGETVSIKINNRKRIEMFHCDCCLNAFVEKKQNAKVFVVAR